MDQLIRPYLSNAISLLYTPESFSFQTSQELLKKVTGHKLPGKSCFNVSFVPSCPDHHDHDDHDEDDEHDNHGDHEEVEGYVRRLEVIHKEVRVV